MTMADEQIRFDDGEAYEDFMGQWSLLAGNAFLDWLPRRRQDRPFFAFLNYFDAHVPYVPSPGFRPRFGISPQTSRDYQMLLNFEFVDKEKVPVRDILMNRDCYDDCIAFLDEQLGKLLDELDRQHLLDSTLVIITSDHGEAFGEKMPCGLLECTAPRC